MRKHFEYLMKLKPEADITIEDIGNCCLLAYNDLGETEKAIISCSIALNNILGLRVLESKIRPVYMMSKVLDLTSSAKNLSFEYPL